MKTITLQVEHVDQIIIDDLKDVYLMNNRYDKVDCSDYELLKAIQTVLGYYMTAEEYDLWNDEERDHATPGRVHRKIYGYSK
jgi:hypothetical protein